MIPGVAEGGSKMKIAVTAQGPTLDSAIDPRFGRCRYLILADTLTDDWTAIPNPVLGEPGGAGIAMAQRLAQEKVEALITGNVGPNAARALSAGGIPVYIAGGGTVRQALGDFHEGRLAAASGPTVSAHSGT